MTQIRPLRVLQVDKFLHPQGGAPVYMLNLARRQRHAGYDVEFFSMTDERNEPSRYADRFAPHVELFPFPKRVDNQVKVLRQMIWSTAARRGFEEVLADFRPDIVHVHNIYHQLSPSILWAAERAGVPVVMTVHDYKLICASYVLHDGRGPCDACVGKTTFANAVRKRCRNGSLAASSALALESTVHRLTRAYRPVDAFICPSRFLRDQLVRSDIFPDRLVHVPNFIDIDAIAPADDAGEGVVYAGRLAAVKGLAVLIEAMGRLPGAHLDCYGHGPERAELEALADRVAPGRVVFHGPVGPAEVFEAYRRAAVAVLPSIWPENMPLSILEAMAAARPVVTTTLGGAPELIDDGVTGTLVPPTDVGALAGAIGELLADPEPRLRMGRAARARVEAHHSPEVHLEQIAAVYDRVLRRERALR